MMVIQLSHRPYIGHIHVKYYDQIKKSQSNVAIMMLSVIFFCFLNFFLVYCIMIPENIIDIE